MAEQRKPNKKLGVGTGKVKFFNSEKKFGFITKDDGGGDIFFHDSNVTFEGIQKDDKVKFDIEEGKKGPQASNVDIVE